MVRDFGFRVSGSWRRVSGLDSLFRVGGPGFRVWGLG
jgi:hypothetical protein